MPIHELSTDLAEKLKAFHTTVQEEAEKIIFETFPNKVLYLQDLITKASQDASNPFHISQFSRTQVSTVIHGAQNGSLSAGGVSEAASVPQTKKRKLERGVVDIPDGGPAPAGDLTPKRYLEWVDGNDKLRDTMELLRKEFEDLVSLADKVKLWVNLMMPKVEDGDNFGVEVQEQALAELHRAQDSGLNLLDFLKGYHMNRAKICSKLVKYPNSADYAEALRRHDERTFFTLRQNLYDLRGVYVVLMDILHKNIQKIRAPRGNNRAGMY